MCLVSLPVISPERGEMWGPEDQIGVLEKWLSRLPP